ncbi:STAS domain-containing protein [Streptomyces sp. ISL-36]|uniref:STAS domain-containing protein n=1 Tax=Streptomyces sp. ISL-36 TaxID=2819182 RepID=UPI001BEC0E02|nr:STAS domain-containing protein [Streptomyces sp. ISL-36]MBT2442099.1 STAS domain-containing protein [Streptomyces sp. ISL-36]
MRPDEEFRAVTRSVGERAVVTVCGEIDIDTGPLLQDALDEALAVCVAGIDVNFSHVTFCDCVGLTVLLRARADARQRGIGFGVCEVRIPSVRNLFTTTGTDTLLADRRAAA